MYGKKINVSATLSKLVLVSGIIISAAGIATYVWVQRRTGQPLDITNLWRIPQNNKNITTNPDGTTLYNYSTGRIPIPIAP